MAATTRSLTAAFGLVLVVSLLSARPSEGQVAVIGKLTMERTAAAGATYQDFITIQNASTEPQRASLIITDYLFDADGTSRFDPPPSHARSNGSWITLSQTLVSIPPGEEVRVPYTVTVPNGGAGIFGSYWSAIAVERQGADPALSRSAGGVTLDVKMRYIVQVATHIGTTGEVRLVFADPKIDGRRLLLAVTDTGTRACRPALRVEVYSADGTLLKEVTAQRGLLYPATSFQQVVELPVLEPGTYRVLLYADIGAEQVQGQKFQITVR